MEKSKPIRVAAGTVIAALLTTCLIGGTFAKFTTAVSASDHGRLANWGFQSSNSIDLSGMFSSKYTHVNSSSSDEDIIAPGTEGSVTFAFAYDETNSDAPEVDYEFSVDVDAEAGSGIKANPTIKFKLDTGDWGSFDTLVANIKNLSGDTSGTETYEAGELPDAFGTEDTTHTIYWKWDYTDTTNVTKQDATDTSLGNATTLEDCRLAITITATQID